MKSYRPALLTLVVGVQFVAFAPVVAALSIFQVGNSLTIDSMANTSYVPWEPRFPIGTEVMLEEALGEPVDLAYHTRGNTTLQYMWENPTAPNTNYTSFGYHTEALTDNSWDYLTLQTFPSIFDPIPTLGSEVVAMQNFIQAADIGSGGATNIIVYGPWPGSPENEWTRQWNMPVIDDPETEAINSAAYHNLLYDKIEALYPGRVQLASAGKVVRRVRDLILASEAPIATTSALYRDLIHLSELGRFIASTTMQQVILQRSTVGQPIDRTVPNWQNPAIVTDEQAAWIQLVTWEVLLADQRSGVLTPAAGDYDGNGVVNEGDFSVWKTFYGSTTRLLADGNNNGVVDAADYTIWRDAFAAAASLIAVPEPSAGLLTMAMSALLVRRRRVVRGVDAA